ncbi:hypothetical protein DPX39_050031500 [Trypanosoma brucei equiperdum]|uniref:Uncharacterized protein n=1 Tax=Trypanosoma brucei equiperdum TaxID=630700 RepID=A0A3L6L7G2_9TRYP|nr:hypothetical protein DPX39_050031500 [Trypanosoma brucei equiperdum]
MNRKGYKALPREYDEGFSEERVGHALNKDAPSKTYEEFIVRRLQEIMETAQSDSKKPATFGRAAAADVFLRQDAPITVTFAMLATSCAMHPTTDVVTFSVLFAALYTSCMALQVLLLWLRITEKRQSAISVMQKVLTRWKKRLVEGPPRDKLDRRTVFRLFSSFLPASAFRIVAVVDTTTGRLKRTLKCLVMKGALRLHRTTLKVSRHTEPIELFKLVDIVRMILKGEAVMLRSLPDMAPPPRHPNVTVDANINGTGVEGNDEDISTDESDDEYDTRCEANSVHALSVPQQMAFLVYRFVLLAWLLGIVACTFSGYIYHVLTDIPLSDGVFLNPAVALLGLLPVNAKLLNSILVMYANVNLECLFRHLVSKTTHSVDDRIPRLPFRATMQAFRRATSATCSRPPLCFSSSLVETLGTTTVVALLDTTGVVTDMVPLPTRLLMLKSYTAPETPSSTSSTTTSDSDNDEFNGAAAFTGLDHSNDPDPFLRAANFDPEYRLALKRQVRQKKTQKRRFLELQLAPGTDDDLAVQFADCKERQKWEKNVDSLSLCLLIHAMAPEPTKFETWQEPLRFCDQTPRWGPSIHWVPRASEFDDSLAKSFRIVARIFHINTVSWPGRSRECPEQTCTLLVVASDGLLHAFTVGTVCMVTHSCPFHFNGYEIEGFDEELREEVVNTGTVVWKDGRGLETVAASHTMLPDKFRSCAESLPREDGSYAEFLFYNGVQITADNCLAELKLSPSGEPSTNGCEGTNEEVPRECFLGVPTNTNGSTPATSEADVIGAINSSERDAINEGNSFCCSKGFTDIHGNSHLSFVPTSVELLGDLLHILINGSHAFLGLVGLQDSIRPNVQNAMSVLDEAGIRCMYFCSDGERRTKSLGNRLGLETDWNCCISLDEGAKDLDAHSIRAQLPVGIKSIRRHIVHVDSIPSQVNMFSHAHSASTRAMLSILQDNHEVVSAIGSTFNHSNVRSYIQADLSVGVLPQRRGAVEGKEGLCLENQKRISEPSDIRSMKSETGDQLVYRDVVDLIGCACTLSDTSTTSMLPIVTTLIRQARFRLSGIGNCISFVMHANFFVTFLNVIPLIIGGPLLIQPAAAVFELNVIIPILALSCTYTAYADKDPMKSIQSRHNHFVRLKILRHSAVVWCLRYIPSLAALLALGITCGLQKCDKGSLHELALSSSDKCMAATRGYIGLTLNYWLMIHSWTHMSRYDRLSPAFLFKPRYGGQYMYLFTSARWVAANALTVFFSVAFVVAETFWDGILEDAFFPSRTHFYISAFFPVLLVLLDIPIKSWRLKRATLMQKFRQLSFGTRLGMHSPRGDYEPEVGSATGCSGGANEGGGGVQGSTSDANVRNELPLRRRLQDAFYRFTTMRRGKLELNCVCCDHIGGNYATYHINANDM